MEVDLLRFWWKVLFCVRAFWLKFLANLVDFNQFFSSCVNFLFLLLMIDLEFFNKFLDFFVFLFDLIIMLRL